MFVLARAVTYSTLFIGFLLVFLPRQLLQRYGVPTPDRFGPLQLAGCVVTIAGAAIALACILTFVFVGRGTPAPFDPPRRLVDRGPYAVIRNPMYAGAALALLGASLVYGSLALLGYAVFFLVVTHLFVVFYEEPTLRRVFGADYDAYVKRVGRWLPFRRRES